MNRKNLTIVFAITLAVFVTLTCVWLSKTKEAPATEIAPSEAGSSLLNLVTVSDGIDQTIKDKNAEGVSKLADRIQKEPLLFTLMCIFGVLALASGAMLVAPGFVKRSW